MSLRAQIQRWAGLPFEDIRNLLTWLDPRKANLEINNPNLLVASASGESGENLAYATVESVFLVESCVVAPQVTESTGQQAFDAIVSKIEQSAKILKVSPIMLVLPEDAPSASQENWIRVVESKMPQPS